MRSLLTLIIVGAIAFVLVAMYVAPVQPELRAWYLRNACEHLDKASPQICARLRKAEIGYPDLSTARRALDWFFRDRRTGAITIGQWPNPPLLIFGVCAAVDWLFAPAGSLGSVLRLLGALALTYWAMDETPARGESVAALPRRPGPGGPLLEPRSGTRMTGHIVRQCRSEPLADRPRSPIIEPAQGAQERRKHDLLHRDRGTLARHADPRVAVDQPRA